MNSDQTRSHVSPPSGKLLSVKEAIAILENRNAKGMPIPFAITFCTADETRNTGGEIIHYPAAVWHVPPRSTTPPATGSVAAIRSAAQRWQRRIRAIDSDQVRPVHAHLILTINGQTVR